MSKKQSSTPHDALFKLFLRQPETARDFLAFHLPAPIHALVSASFKPSFASLSCFRY